MSETFLFLQKLLRETTGIPLNVIPYDKAALIDFLQNRTDYIFDSFFLKNASLWQYLFPPTVQLGTICRWQISGGITFLLYAAPEESCVFCLGPVGTQTFSKEETPQFYSSLAEVSDHVLNRTGELVFGHLSGYTQPMQILQIDPPVLESHAFQPSFSGDTDIVHMRQIETRYEYSAALTDAVKQGNLSLATHLIGHYDPGSQTPVRNTNPLRNAQNYCIVLNTQLRHALEESGVHPYRVDKLSNQIGLEIEQLKSTKQLADFFIQVIRRYCRLVQEHNYPNLKPLTNLAVTYIKEHLADNLTVKDTAKALTVNANYLSTLFHRDMGMTFIDFVNRERTKQAAALLKHTNLQIQQIASTVGYNNTSYFAKQFLRFQHTSPSHYRRGSL